MRAASRTFREEHPAFAPLHAPPGNWATRQGVTMGRLSAVQLTGVAVTHHPRPCGPDPIGRIELPARPLPIPRMLVSNGYSASTALPPGTGNWIVGQGSPEGLFVPVTLRLRPFDPEPAGGVEPPGRRIRPECSPITRRWQLSAAGLEPATSPLQVDNDQHSRARCCQPRLALYRLSHADAS